VNTTTSRYATSLDDVVPGALVKHVTTGGQWRVLSVNDDGSIRAVSDMGATRTVPAEKVLDGIHLAQEDELTAAGHLRKVHVDNRDSGTYGYRCECGLSDGDYAHRLYAVDAWREAHGLDPVITYPLV
jgi:hypothetical protein